MGVDDAGHHKLACAVDDARVCGSVEILPDAGNLAVANQHICIRKRAARDGEYGRVANQRLLRCLTLCVDCTASACR